MDKNEKDLYAYRVYGMEKAFRDLPKEGAKERFEHIKYFANIGIEHIQGYTQYQCDNTMYYIFTHHTAGDYGYIMIANGMDCTKETVIRTPIRIQSSGRRAVRGTVPLRAMRKQRW